MSKYTFDRIGADGFEELAQALLEKLFRIDGNLVQFGAGADGAREATWTQPVDHPTYKRPLNIDDDVPKEWVFQAKYHDIGLRGWAGARAEVESELADELDKLVNKYEVPCHKYIMITNVPFSGVRHVGTRDKVNAVIEDWKKRVPEIEVWDAVDLSRMLDADPQTRMTYLNEVLPGDVLQAFLAKLNFSTDRRKSAFHAYLKSILDSEREAKAEEAGDESGLELEKIFVDLDLKLIVESLKDLEIDWTTRLFEDDEDCHLPHNLESIPASFAFLRAEHESMLLKGGPGVGKSTITQFLTLYHAARLIDHELSVELAQRLKLTGNVSAATLDAHCRVRFPLRVELRRYAQWMTDPKKKTTDTFLARYLAERIGQAASADLKMDDVFYLASTNPLLLIFDGLDEVPHPRLRDTIFSELRTFLNRCEGESSDIQLILSSRPQGYRGEFDGFYPIEWHVVDLESDDFENYADRWLKERISNVDERKDARQRIDDGMQAPAVRQMATTLLQATVMLTIARRKHPIPHARHTLYKKYVEVIFERERNKQMVRKRGPELLRLHELVGFDLIRKMELAKGPRTLGGEDFRQCVRQVIEDYGPIELEEVTIGEVVEEIVMLSKDRLCLLAGKGEDQEDVDFVIQPFREYFAAAYLYHHEDADPDRVYASLVDRRHIWANVLQFYSAFQSKAQQKNWISEADGEDVNQEGYGGIVQMTRRRRALLRVLPEFERPKNEYIKRAFRNLFDVPTRWTWRERSDTAQLLRAFAPDETHGMLRNIFGDLSIEDASNLFVELDLIAKSTERNDKVAFGQSLERFLEDERLRPLAIEVGFSNDVEMNICDYPVEAFDSNLAYRTDFPEHYCPHFFKGFSTDQLLDLVFLGSNSHLLWQHSDIAEQEWCRDLLRCLLSTTTDAGFHGFGIGLPPFLIDRREQLKVLDESRIKKSQSRIAPYLLALLRAIERPTDPSLFEHAENRRAEIEGQLPNFLSIDFQLGPKPAQFSNAEEWATARNATSTAAKQINDLWLSHLSLRDNSWLTLLFHPDAWPMLHPIIAREKLQVLLGKCQSVVKILSPFEALPIQFHHWTARKPDAFQVCTCVVEIIEKHGSQFVQHDPLRIDDLLSAKDSAIDLPGAQELLGKAIELDRELPTTWAGVIMRVCSTVTDIGTKELLHLWKRHASHELISVNNTVPPKEALIKQAIDVGTPDAVNLAAFLASTTGRNSPVKLSTELSQRIVRCLCDMIDFPSSHEPLICIQLLLQQTPDASELATWANREVVEALRSRPWYLNILAARLRDMVSRRDTFDHDQVRKDFGVFVDRRLEFPYQIPLAALEAILRLDELSATPLTDKDWQG